MPSGAPALPFVPPTAAAPTLPVPYGPPVPPQASEPDDEPALVAQAKTAVLEERFADAVKLLEEFLREHPADARAWHRLAGARTGLGLYQWAIEAADRSVELDPECAPAHLMRAVALYGLHRWSEVEQAAARSIELDPSKADAHALLAEALSRRGAVEAAEEAARVALAIDPGQRAALRVLARNAPSIARWMPLVTAASVPAGTVLGVLTLMTKGSPEAAVFGGFAVGAFLPLFTAVLRWALGSRDAVVRTRPRRFFPLVPVAATAYVATPLAIAGTRWPGAPVVLLLTAAFAVFCTIGLYRDTARHTRGDG
ncbi:tetratricopeptide repeat protein [Actinoplanes regularis]|uniref:tetratricopeptide repeat protein n=1 Tax=Actinoplanes regularis TaxID=52697 RepID=UPI0024A0D331|nr:tetratricopeptide repeat protein [Actinoplanes regularis]GLW28962.1 hypothetical protein Areg01_19020 [Actinoplanes regularis]